jgi:hypothetical protein
LTNFYDNKATRNQDGSYSVKKESLYTTIKRHQTHFKAMYDAYEKISNIDKCLDGQERGRQNLFFANILQTFPLAIDLAKKNTEAHDYWNQISQSLNPDEYFNLDIEYGWDDESAPDEFYRLGKYLRTTKRVKQDKSDGSWYTRTKVQL